MNESFAFFGRKREIDELLSIHAFGEHVLIVGPAGIGKTALLREIRQYCSLLVCEETSSLRRICDSLERQLGWAQHMHNVIERKNRLLAYLMCRCEPVAFDQLTRAVPRVARFIAHLGEQIPVWIACRSDQPHEVGHIWPELYKFTRVEISPLTEIETRALVAEAVAKGNVQADAREHVNELHQMTGGNPRILEQLLIELEARKYEIDQQYDRALLEFLSLYANRRRRWMEQSINALRNGFDAFADMYRANFEAALVSAIPADSSVVENDLQILREWNTANQAAAVSSF